MQPYYNLIKAMQLELDRCIYFSILYSHLPGKHQRTNNLLIQAVTEFQVQARLAKAREEAPQHITIRHGYNLVPVNDL